MWKLYRITVKLIESPMVESCHVRLGGKRDWFYNRGSRLKTFNSWPQGGQLGYFKPGELMGRTAIFENIHSTHYGCHGLCVTWENDSLTWRKSSSSLANF